MAEGLSFCVLVSTTHARSVSRKEVAGLQGVGSQGPELGDAGGLVPDEAGSARRVGEIELDAQGWHDFANAADLLSPDETPQPNGASSVSDAW